MPIAFVLKWKRWIQHYFGIRANRIEIHPRVSGYVYALLGAIVTLAALLVILYFSRNQEEYRDTEALKEHIAYLESQIAQSGGALTNLEISRSTIQKLTNELRQMTGERNQLEDDLTYFLRLVPAGTMEGSAHMDRLAVRRDPSSDRIYYFSVLIGYVAGRRTEEFSGNLRLTLTVERNGQLEQIPWPDKNLPLPEEYIVKTHQWVRQSGLLKLNAGDTLKKVEVRLWQGNTLRDVASIDL